MPTIHKFIIVTFLLFSVKSVLAQRVTTSGKEFYVSFFKNGNVIIVNDSTNLLYITAKVNTSGTVSNPNTGFSLPFNVIANTVTKVAIPATQCYNTVESSVKNLGLIVTGLDTLSVSAMCTITASSDGTLVLQTNALGTEYIVMGYTGVFNNPSFASAFLIEATENQTNIEITPKSNLSTGELAGVPFTITLNRGQTYLVTAIDDLSGSTVKVVNSCKKIAVFGGSTGAQVPLMLISADILYEQLFPVNSFGNKFIIPTLLGRNTARVKVTGAYPGSQIRVDGVLVNTINTNQVYEYTTDNKPQLIESNNPIQVSLFANGQQYDNSNGPSNPGDPSMMLIQPIEQQITDVSFISANVNNVINHKFSVVCKTADIGTMLLDGVSIASSFQPVQGNLNFSAAALNVTSGQHIAKNINGFSGYVYGFGSAQGYSYNVGSYVEEISNHFICNGFSSADTFTVKVCKGPSTFTVLAPTLNGTFSWSFGDGTAIVNTVGTVVQQIHNFANTGTYIVSLTITNTCNATPVVRQLKIQVVDQLNPSVSLLVSPSTNVCSGTLVTFRANAVDAGVNPTYKWKLNGNVVGTNFPQFTSSTLSNNDVVSCEVTSTVSCASIATATASSTITIFSSFTPTLTITTPSTTNCANEIINFTTQLGAAYTSPVYQWKVNNVNVGTNSANYSYTPANGDIITCALTIAPSSCATTTTANSNSVVMSVTPIVSAPTITIQVTQNDQCAGSMYDFTSSTTNGGNAPIYQWKKNGISVGNNAPTYQSSALNNNDIITCSVTSNSSCVTNAIANSNAIVVLVKPILTPSISIAASAIPVCKTDTVIFIATTTHPGNNPQYQWYINNQLFTTTATNTFRINSLVNNDVLSCILISNADCVINPANSNTIIVPVKDYTDVTTQITANKNPICKDEFIILNATILNGGANPVYIWKLNNNIINNSIPTYTSNSLQNNDIITLTVKSSNTCVKDGLSNPIQVLVNPLPVVQFSQLDTIILFGSSIMLQPSISNAITNYTWVPNYRIDNTGIKTPTVNPLTSTLYKLAVADVNGCIGGSSYFVKVFRRLLMPTAFTPNKDGMNDWFIIPADLQLNINQFTVYNRWGQIVFETTDSKKGWDGMLKGKLASVGTYIWVISYTDLIQKKEVQEKGTVILIR
jgi:gliding motility-associated-like protein